MSKNTRRGLIIKKHWLDLILSGEKTWEMRSTKTNVRGTIELIQAKSGLIVGSVEIIDSLDRIDKETFYNNADKHHIADLEKAGKWLCPWVLRNPRRFEHPVSYKHPSGTVIWVRL